MKIFEKISVFKNPPESALTMLAMFFASLIARFLCFVDYIVDVISLYIICSVVVACHAAPLNNGGCLTVIKELAEYVLQSFKEYRIDTKMDWDDADELIVFFRFLKLFIVAAIAVPLYHNFNLMILALPLIALSIVLLTKVIHELTRFK